METPLSAVERRGLYYPWVHFHSDDWLKKALIVFPGLVRMVADDQIPNDTSSAVRNIGDRWCIEE
jgi:hypothetical protein